MAVVCSTPMDTGAACTGTDKESGIELAAAAEVTVNNEGTDEAVVSTECTIGTREGNSKLL